MGHRYSALAVAATAALWVGGGAALGQSETSTDPAPYSMMETTIMLKPKEKRCEG